MKPERVYYLNTFVAGRLYHDADKAWPHLNVGQRVELRGEPDNPKDSSAVAVWATTPEGSLKLGYIPVKSNQPLSLMLLMGWSDAFEASISRLDPSSPYDRQIGVTVRVVRRDISAAPEAPDATSAAEAPARSRKGKPRQSGRKGGILERIIKRKNAE